MKIEKNTSLPAGTIVNHNGTNYELGAYSANHGYEVKPENEEGDFIKRSPRRWEDVLTKADLTGDYAEYIPERINLEADSDDIEINIVLHESERISFTKFINISDLHFMSLDEAKEAAEIYYEQLMEELDNDYNDYPLTAEEEGYLSGCIGDALQQKYIHTR